MLKSNKQEIINKFAQHGSDTGSTEVQVALLTTKITALTDHMKANKNDNHSRRGLLLMVSKRRRLLNYLKNNNVDSYKNLLAALGLRK